MSSVHRTTYISNCHFGTSLYSLSLKCTEKKIKIDALSLIVEVFSYPNTEFPTVHII